MIFSLHCWIVHRFEEEPVSTWLFGETSSAIFVGPIPLEKSSSFEGFSREIFSWISFMGFLSGSRDLPALRRHCYAMGRRRSPRSPGTRRATGSVRSAVRSAVRSVAKVFDPGDAEEDVVGVTGGVGNGWENAMKNGGFTDQERTALAGPPFNISPLRQS